MELNLTIEATTKILKNRTERGLATGCIEVDRMGNYITAKETRRDREEEHYSLEGNLQGERTLPDLREVLHQQNVVLKY